MTTIKKSGYTLHICECCTKPIKTGEWCVAVVTGYVSSDGGIPNKNVDYFHASCDIAVRQPRLHHKIKMPKNINPDPANQPEREKIKTGD